MHHTFISVGATVNKERYNEVLTLFLESISLEASQYVADQRLGALA
jgi:hypothetical protein